MGKANKRPGFSALRGAINAPSAAGTLRPLNPRKNTVWTDTQSNAQYRWDGSAWQLLSVINQNTNTSLKVWVGTAAEYAALTPDATTLYFVT